MYLMFKRSPRYILMIVIMAVGMMMSSMGTFASHGTNGLTGYEMNLHDAEVTMTVQDHSHDSDIPQSGHAGHHQTDHFHELPQSVCRDGGRVPRLCGFGCFRHITKDESVNG